MVIVLGLDNLFSEKVVWRSATYHTVDTLKHNVDEQSIAEFCILQEAMVGSTYHCATAFLSPWCFILKTSKNNDILTFCTVFWLFLKDCAPCKRFWSASQEEASWRLSPGLLEMTLFDWIRNDKAFCRICSLQFWNTNDGWWLLSIPTDYLAPCCLGVARSVLIHLRNLKIRNSIRPNMRIVSLSCLSVGYRDILFAQLVNLLHKLGFTTHVAWMSAWEGACKLAWKDMQISAKTQTTQGNAKEWYGAKWFLQTFGACNAYFWSEDATARSFFASMASMAIRHSTKQPRNKDGKSFPVF